MYCLLLFTLSLSLSIYIYIYTQTLITDGKTQSAQFDEFAYHESLVHPALLKCASSGSPAKTVFIGGGGELATAREVLRHSSVERLVMVDIDEKVIEVSREYLPEWGGDKVMSDPRFELIVGDAYAYLMETKEAFDVIIMDISDPIEAGPGIMLYTKEFYEHAVTLLRKPNGVFVTQAGMAESIPVAYVNKLDGVDPSCYAPIYNTLQAVFDSVLPYSTHIPSYGSDWGFIMAFHGDTESGSAKSWKVPPEDLIDGLIERLIDGGRRALKFYDGESHLSCFALTKPLRAYIQKDDRIMTKDDPVFMF